MSALSISSMSRIGRAWRLERLPEFAAADVVADVLHARVAELAVAQAADGVVVVEALLRLGGRLDVPFDQRGAQRFRHFAREHGLAGAGLAFDEQRAFEHDGRVYRDAQVVRGDVGVRSFKAHVYPSEGTTTHPRPLPMGEGVPPCPLRGRSLSRGERDRVRGVTPIRYPVSNTYPRRTCNSYCRTRKSRR